MQATRQQILDHLRANPWATVRELGEALGLTPTGIRQHITILEQEGLVRGEEQRGRVGRPAFSYALTGDGEARYPKRYEQLATALANEVRAQLGEEVVERVLRGTAQRLAQQLRPGLRLGGDAEQRVESLVRALRAEQVVCDWEQEPGDQRDGERVLLLHQRTCPYPEVARDTALTCSMDVALVEELTGLPTELAECAARGDACCTFRLSTSD